MSVVGALVLFYIVSMPTSRHILVDESTRSIIWTNSYVTGHSTDRLEWDQVRKLEYVISQGGNFRVVAVTLDGDRKVVKEDKSPIKTEADQYAKLMEKDLEVIDKTRGFHTLGNDE
jgi:hypothetical protein